MVRSPATEVAGDPTQPSPPCANPSSTSSSASSGARRRMKFHYLRSATIRRCIVGMRRRTIDDAEPDDRRSSGGSKRCSAGGARMGDGAERTGAGRFEMVCRIGEMRGRTFTLSSTVRTIPSLDRSVDPAEGGVSPLERGVAPEVCRGSATHVGPATSDVDVPAGSWRGSAGSSARNRGRRRDDRRGSGEDRRTGRYGRRRSGKERRSRTEDRRTHGEVRGLRVVVGSAPSRSAGGGGRMLAVAFGELDVVRVTRLLAPTRRVHGTEDVARPPRVGDVGTIVHVLGEDAFVVECVDPTEPVRNSV